MARIDRRRLLQLSGAGALAASSGGIAAILAAGRAPAYAQTATIHWLRWADFVPASDMLLKEQIVPQCEKALGIKLNLEPVNANDIQKRITAAIEAGSGPDIFYMIGNWPQLYIKSLSDVTDVAEEIGNAQGGYYDVSGLVANDGTKWVGVPWNVVGVLLPTANPGSPRSATATVNFRRPGKNTARPARSLRQTGGHSDSRLATPGGIRQPSGTPFFGPGAARKSNTTARPWC